MTDDLINRLKKDIRLLQAQKLTCSLTLKNWLELSKIEYDLLKRLENELYTSQKTAND